jgi:GH15 family glucan-1,4-alpha-glucosidase
LYFPDTAVLVTRFMTEAGVGEVIDFMPISGMIATSRRQLIRMVRCVRGQMTFALDIAPRFDYGREAHQTYLTDDGAVFQGDRTSMTVGLIKEPDDESLAQTHVDGSGDLHAEVTLKAGQTRGLVLETGVAGPIRSMTVAEAWRLFNQTVDFWETWLGQSTYAGRWREELSRSAITLKLMTYAPTGGLVAAPTASLPEQVGGERNWDYRYTWVRDASFSV